MKFFLQTISVGVFIFFLTVGGYIGYLSALVDRDEASYLEQVQAVTDKQRLEKQLARAKSILDARRRAYLKKSEEFLMKVREEKFQNPPASGGPNSKESIPDFKPPSNSLNEDKVLEQNVTEAMKRVQDAKVNIPVPIKEDQKDLQFFSDEVSVLTEMVARQPSDEDIHQAMQKKKPKKEAPSTIRRLLLLADKQKQLSQEWQQAKTGVQYWQENEKPAPESISITVSSKDDVKRDINPLHATQISTALAIMPASFPQRIHNIYIVYGDPSMRRGMTGVGVTMMKGEEADFFRVLVHEFGHIYDLYREVSDGTKSNFYDGDYRLFVEDPSVTYYALSWSNVHDRTAELPSFASSYGMSDPFEDFAESFTLYVLQQKTFVAWGAKYPVMKKKYDFLSQVFAGRVFPAMRTFDTEPYDVTMMTVDYEQLLGR